MLTRDEMYDLYFNKGYVIAVRLDEFGAFVGDLIDRGYITLDIGKNMYQRAKNYSECKNENVTYWMGKVYDNEMPTMLFLDYVETAVNERYLILYSAQDTVKNITSRISERARKMKDNDNTIKKYKAQIKELHQKISGLMYEMVGSLYIDISCDEERLKQYGIDA